MYMYNVENTCKNSKNTDINSHVERGRRKKGEREQEQYRENEKREREKKKIGGIAYDVHRQSIISLTSTLDNMLQSLV